MRPETPALAPASPAAPSVGSSPSSAPSPTWLVLDTRTAEKGVSSGVSRFVVGLAGGLAHVMATMADRQGAGLRLLLVGKHEPAPWIIALVQKYPGLVSYWSGGPGALSRKSDKPVWLWPSKVVGDISRFTRENFVWIAPGNFDRPVLWPFGRSRWRARLVQIIHDTIPFTQKGSMGFFFRTQFTTLVKRTLASFPHVMTVSRHSADALGALVPKRTRPVSVVGNGIEAVFGSYAKVLGEERVRARMRFLEVLVPSATDSAQRGQLERIAHARWVVGVGRYQKYKDWEVVEEALPAVRSQLSEGVWFFRVGYCAKDAHRFLKAEQVTLDGATLLPGLGMVGIPELSDSLLAVLYTLADACAHPSRAEGFGLPPLEAAFCGTPVVFRSGTAVGGHFEGVRLPRGFAVPEESGEPMTWARSLCTVMRDSDEPSTELGAFLRKLASAPDTRAMMGPRLGADRYEWTACASRFLEALGTQAGNGASGAGQGQGHILGTGGAAALEGSA